MKDLLGIPPEDYDLFDALAEQLEESEGRRNHVYEDTEDNWTIGIGHLLAKGLPDVVIDCLLICDMKEAADELTKIYPEWRELDQTRQLVLLDMTFNLGPSRFLTFKKFWKALKAGEFEEASEEMLDSKWARQVKGRAKKLAKMMWYGSSIS